MTEALASRIAGAKLGGIVAVLLVPMLLLSYFMMQALRGDIAFTSRELEGLAFNRMVKPVMIGAASGTVRPGDMDRLRGEGAVLARRLGVEKELAGAVATYFSTGADKRFVVRPLYELLAKSATTSNIILDSQPETNHLGSAFGINLPRLLSDYVETGSIRSRAMRDNAISQAELINLLLATGGWRRSQDRMADAFSAAKLATAQPQAYAALDEQILDLGQYPAKATRIFNAGTMEHLAGALSTATEFSDLASHIVGDIDTLWSNAAARYENLLRDRLGSLRARLVFMLCVAAAACLAGAGSAGLMFRSTLRQLDAVQGAREQAEHARQEAVASSVELQRVSDDVIRLNHDLSSNLQMLREAQDEALRKGRLSQLGQLTATVAHELRNPLGAVRTSAFLLERKVKDKGLGVEPQLQRISSGITRCDNIITQLLDFARSRSLSFESLDFDGWLEQVLTEEALKLPDTVTVNYSPGLAGAKVRFDPGRLTRVIVNLVANAAEAMASNGGESARHAIAAPVIEVSTRAVPRGIEIRVADNGPGMTDEVRQKVLEPLFTTKSFGTGLGLPAVEKILQEHGGGLDIDSSPGNGCVVTAWLMDSGRAEEAA